MAKKKPAKSPVDPSVAIHRLVEQIDEHLENLPEPEPPSGPTDAAPKSLGGLLAMGIAGARLMAAGPAVKWLIQFILDTVAGLVTSNAPAIGAFFAKFTTAALVRKVADVFGAIADAMPAG